MQYLKGIGHFVPLKYVAQFFLKRFVGKFVDEDRPIDLSQATFDGDSVSLVDLNLNCKVLNEGLIGRTALRFVKFRIGQLTVNFQLGLKPKVSLSVDQIEIDLMPLAEPERAPSNQQTGGPGSSAPKDGIKGHSRDRELQIVNEFIGNFLQNLEVTVTNIAVRVLTREQKSFDDKAPIPTLLFRITSVQFKNLSDNEKSKDFNRNSALMCLLAGKQLGLGDISLHLMKDKWLDTHEYAPESYTAAKLDKLEFPHTYPLLNHPSTLLLIKGLSRQESLWIELTPEKANQLAFKALIGNIELLVSLKQLEILTRFTEAVKQPEPDSNDLPIQPILQGKQSSKQQETQPNKSLSASWHETSDQMKQSLAQEIASNEDLMKSIDDSKFPIEASVFDQEVKDDQQTPVGLRGTINMNLVQMTLLCARQFRPNLASEFELKDDLEEDRIFQVFQRDDFVFTSAHAYYQATLTSLTVDVRRLPDKPPFKMGIPCLSFQVKRFFKDQHASDLEETNLNNSTLFKTATDDFDIIDQSMGQLVQPFDVIQLFPSPPEGIKWQQETIVDVKNISMMVKPRQVQAGVDKVFVKIATLDLILALHIGKALQPTKAGAVSKKPLQNTKGSTGSDTESMEVKVDIVGIELELSLSAKTGSYQQFVVNKLPKVNHSAEHQIAVNIFKIKLRHREKQTIPVLAIEQIELALQNKKHKKVTLLCLNQTELSKLQETSPLNIHSLASISDTRLAKSDGASDSDIMDMAQPILVQTSSSVDQTSSDKKPTFLFQIDQHKQGLKLAAKSLACELCAKDIQFFAEFMKEQEPAVKHASNLVDIGNLLKAVPIPSPVILTEPMWLQISLQQLQIVLLSSRPLMQMRLDSLSIDLRLQKRDNKLNVEVDYKLQNLLVVDHWNPDMDLFVQQPSPSPSAVDASASQINHLKRGDLKTSEDLILSGKCMVHSSNSQLPLIKGSVKVCIVEESQMRDRISVQQLNLQTARIQQVFLDLGEMKNNPLQVQLTLRFNCLNVYFTTQIKQLLLELQRIGRKVTKHFAKVFTSDLVPTFKHEQSWHLNLKQVDLSLHEFSLVYQPALTQEQIEQQLGLPKSQQSQCRKEVLKTCYLTAVRVQKLKLTTNGVDSHNLATQLVQVLFLREADPYQLVNWVNYSDNTSHEQSQLELKGFVPIVSLTSPNIRVRPSKVKVKLHQITVDACADAVRELTVFQKLAQVGFASGVEQLDEIVEGAVRKSVTQSTLSEEFKTPASELIVIDEAGQHPFLTQSISEEGENTLVNIDVRKAMIAQSYKVQAASQQAQFQRLRQLIDWNYFKPQSQKFRPSKKVHLIPQFLRQVEPTIEIQLELKQLRVTFYAGSDFDFQVDQKESAALKTSSKPMQRSQTMPSPPMTQPRGKILIDKNYMDSAENRETVLQSEELQRARRTKRDPSQYVRLAVMHVTLTRRQFPVTNDHKHKTFALSVGNVELTALHKTPQATQQIQMLETAYCYRHQNFFEMDIVSEKDYTTNIEELQVSLGLRPLIKVTVSYLPIEILKQFFNEANPPAVPQQEQPSQFTQEPVTCEKLPSGKTQVLVKSLSIRETTVQLSIINVASFMSFDGITLQIKAYKLFTPVPVVIPQALDEVQNFYKKQIGLYEIVIQAVSSNSITKEISRGLGSVLSPLYKPIVGARRAGSRGVVAGLGEGINDLASYLSEESWSLGMFAMRRVGFD